MSYLFSQTTFNIGTGQTVGQTLNVAHGLGEAPKALLFFFGGRAGATDGFANAGSSRRGFGMAVGIGSTQQYGMGNGLENGGVAGAQRERRVLKAGSAIIYPLTGGSIAGDVSVTAIDATNVTLTFNTGFSVNLLITMVSIGGSGVNANILNITTPTVGAVPFTSDFTGLGFTPQGNGRSLLVTMGISTNDDTGTVSTDAAYGIGFATSPSQRGVVAGNSDYQHATATQAKGYSFPSECMVGWGSDASSFQYRGDFSAWITDGIRINNLEIGSALKFICLVIDGPRFAIKQANTSTVNGNIVNVTGIGFQAELGLVLSGNSAQSTQDTPNGDDTLSIGTFDGVLGQAAHICSDFDGLATSATMMGCDRTASYLNASSAGQTAEGAVTTIGVDNVVFTFSDGDTGTFQMHLITMASAPSGSRLFPPERIIHRPARAPQRASRW